MRTNIQKVDNNWIDIKNECRNTVGKEATNNGVSDSFKSKLLISQHSPIRLLSIKWRWEGIKSWISVHFARHWLGWDKWISTQRNDRTGINRDKSPQDTPVNMDIKANAEALINVARYRLCYQAHIETRGYMYDLKHQISRYESELANVLVPNCIYRGGCPEFTPCGLWDRFINFCIDYYIENDIINADDMCFDAHGETLKRLTDIQERYDMFTKFCEAKIYFANGVDIKDEM